MITGDVTAFSIHHFYYGILLMLIAFPFLFIAKRRKIMGKSWKWARRLAWTLVVVGLIILSDDFYQHDRQIKDPTYLSPIHNLYGATLYRLEWVRKLNTWADNLF